MAWNPPEWLGKEAKKFYRTYSTMLEEQGALTELDAASFLSMAVAYGVMIEAAKVLAQEGVSAPGSGRDRDSVKKHPAFQIYRDSEATFRAIATSFGLTPMSRGKLALPEPEWNAGGVLD